MAEITDRLIDTNIEDEMKRSYMDYAMSVIIGRALPDVRDGLKPVHRRCLYAMYDMGNDWNKPYKKSARVVGDVIGKYHPHGDTAVYDTIVRMAQDFSLRYPLVDGQGNFGSIDGDRPAAMRYTEIRMDKLAHEILADLDKETVDQGPNYDDSLTEPLVLPTKLPNLLVNGSSGIAVGMATNIPPHNLSEIADAIVAVIKNPQISFDELMDIVPGPDFPTGGFIYGREGIRSAYATGRGIMQMRAKAHVEKQKKGDRESIVVTEIPYQVNKARLVEKIAELVKEKKIEGISDLRDESDREGMRIVIELKKDENSEVILNQLYKQTQMQSSFGAINLAIVNNRPKVLTLREIIDCFIGHRKNVIIRRTIFELKKAEARAHILEGLTIALNNIDEVIEIIKTSASAAEAKERLIARFSFSELQAQAILDMRLHRLTGLERDKIMEEYQAIMKLIQRLKEILASEAEVMKIIVQETEEIKANFGDARRTEIMDEVAEISLEDTIVDEEVVVTFSHGGYVKRNPVTMYRAQKRGGKGKVGMKTKEEDFVEHLFVASTKDYLMFFTDAGRVHWLKVYNIPDAGRTAKGKAIVNLIRLEPKEKITAVLAVKEFTEDRNIIMATRGGVVKKTNMIEYSHPRSGGIAAIKLDDGDKLIAVELTDGKQHVLLATQNGKSIRFHEEEVRTVSRVSRGVRGIALEGGDKVIGMVVVAADLENSALFTVSANGFGKRTDLSEYRAQNRGGKGVITIKVNKRNGHVVDIKQVVDEDDLMLITNYGKILRVSARSFLTIGRNTQGVTLMGMENGEHIASVARLAEKEEEDTDEETEG